MVKTLVVFYSKHGYTREVAKRVADESYGYLLDLSEKKEVDLSSYDKIVIGSAIYAGSVNKRVKKFVEENLSLLLKKRVGLFICCADEKRASEQLESNFPKELLNHAFVKGMLGGEIIMGKLGFFERKIAQMVSKKKDDILNRKERDVDKFVKAVSE